MPQNPNFAPETCHDFWIEAAPQTLSFAKNRGRDLSEWREELRAALPNLLGQNPPRVALGVRREAWREEAEFRELRFVFTSERGADVPCHLLVPLEAKEALPVVICLQGHTPGMHLSLGRAHNESEQEMLTGGRDFALQAVSEGYAALVMEQRCFGERADSRPADRRNPQLTCHHAAMVALLVGRTLIGERVWDVSRAIDALEGIPEVDASRIGCMGNSGGGSVTYYAACVDPRIQILMPSCSVCTVRDSIAAIDHCPDNYLPAMLNFFEMGDLAGLLAPRPLVVVAGRQDEIFPLKGVKRSFQNIQQIYDASGAPNKCRLVVGEGGHRFYPEQAWPVFRELCGW